jgi:hypothetical protein
MSSISAAVKARSQTGFADHLDLLRIFDGFALLQRVHLVNLRRSRHLKLPSFVAKRLPGWQHSLGTRGIS